MNKFQRLASTVLLACISVPLMASQDEGVSVNQPSPAPSGAFVAFSADYRGTNSIWISSLDGLVLRQLTTGDDSDVDPAWSPDGKQIAYTARANGNFDIWLIPAAGSTAPIQLTSKALNNKQPAWSPDGTKIAFISDRSGTNDVWIMNADGSNAKRLTTLAGQENHPSFSPAGDEIVFSETTGSLANLMVVKIDGTGLRTITPLVANDWNPNWSSFGIVFSSNRSNAHWKIWTVKPDGSGLTPVGTTSAIDPAWLPNGQLLFSDEGPRTGALSAVSILNPATGAKKVVTTVAGYLMPIDVRPEMSSNKINVTSNGLLTVAILSSNGFDAFKMVNQSTLKFGATGAESSFYACAPTARDVNSDGLGDLVCRFRIKQMGLKLGDSLAIIRFTDANGVPREGRDAIVTNMSSTPDPLDFPTSW